jgi:hypothetical protein
MNKLKITIILAVVVFLSVLESCGPVLFTARLNNPPPPWFYPNRIETVRYVYFPDHTIYYDLSLSTYFYLENSIWLSATVLPARFHVIDLQRSRYTRINNYYGDNIQQYHNDRRNSSRRNTGTRRKN